MAAMAQPTNGALLLCACSAGDPKGVSASPVDRAPVARMPCKSARIVHLPYDVLHWSPFCQAPRSALTRRPRRRMLRSTGLIYVSFRRRHSRLGRLDGAARSRAAA